MSAAADEGRIAEVIGSLAAAARPSPDAWESIVRRIRHRRPALPPHPDLRLGGHCRR